MLEEQVQREIDRQKRNLEEKRYYGLYDRDTRENIRRDNSILIIKHIYDNLILLQTGQ